MGRLKARVLKTRVPVASRLVHAPSAGAIPALGSLKTDGVQSQEIDIVKNSLLAADGDFRMELDSSPMPDGHPHMQADIVEKPPPAADSDSSMELDSRLVSVGRCRVEADSTKTLPPAEDGDSSTELGSRPDDDSDDDSVEQDDVFDAAETLIIFDWDDTLLCSHWMRLQGLDVSDEAPVSAERRELLNSLAAGAADVLKCAATLGEVVLVTNAEQGWVELSCTRWLPSLVPLLKSLRVVSARSTYEPNGYSNPVDWKYFAFGRELHDFCKRSGRPIRNVISVGDSAHEREALIRVEEGLSQISQCCMKSVKLAERPDIQQLQREHELIGGCLRHIVQHSGNLDLCIQ